MENKELINMMRALLKEEMEPMKQGINQIETKVDKNTIMLEDLNKKVQIIAEVQSAHKEQGDQNYKIILKEQINNGTLLGNSLKNVSADVKEVKIDVIELKETVEGIRKDLNAVEIITSKNWNEIAHLKAVK
ncbi:MAG: hypothetical protein ACREVX_00265 [Clostridium sp.]|uniref:hypothetical protein n=1 Tax=Clostridium sp. TaxID=1506 RepID=UPI003D6CD8D6